ncbi:type VI secretion system lipoprotein TssJ [Enterobacteriaceae bacterium ESL0689]|nr:type VI secretion system lipoprotein TssJ [Enterobacteriaceae bacterium ESL0689]
MLRTPLTSAVRWLIPLMAFSLAGCGLTQRVTDNTKSAFHDLFYKNIKVLHLDFTARETLNTDPHPLSESVVIRVYQLRDRKTFDNMRYPQLLKDGDIMLHADRLAGHDVVVKPGGDVSLDMPLEEDTQFVAVAGLFRHPDSVKNSWKLVIRRDELDPNNPRILNIDDNSLTLQAVKQE